MTVHKGIVGQVTLPESNRDRRLFELLEREARHLLGVRQGWWGESDDRASLDDAVEAGTCVLRWFHGELTARHEEGFTNDRRPALQLMHWRDMALGVLEERTAQERTIWLDAASGGTPRSICVGGREVYDTEALAGYELSRTRGCFAVFEEKMNLSGKKWPDLCPACRHRKPHRTARRAMNRLAGSQR